MVNSLNHLVVDLRNEYCKADHDHQLAHFSAPILVRFQVVFLIVGGYQLFVSGFLLKLTCNGSFTEADDELCKFKRLIKHHWVFTIFHLKQLKSGTLWLLKTQKRL